MNRCLTLRPLNACLIFAFVLSSSMVLSTPDSGYHAIIELSPGNDKAALVGGSQSKRWINAEKSKPRVRGGEQYRFYSLAGPAGNAAGGKAEVQQETGDWWLPVKSAPKHKQDLVGVAAAWNAMPRPVKQQNVDQAVYRQALAGILKAKGLGSSKVNITQILNVDLDGDGESEVLISASNPPELHPDGHVAHKGEYSFVALRKLVGGKVVTRLMGGDFFAKVPAEGATPNIYSVIGVLDLNGDGIMEVVVQSVYYEGYGLNVYELKGGTVRKVLETSGGV